MPGFWKTWSAKTGKKFMNVPNIDGNVDDVEGQVGGCSDRSHAVPVVDFNCDDGDVSNWMLSVEDVDYVIRNNMKCGILALVCICVNCLILC